MFETSGPAAVLSWVAVAVMIVGTVVLVAGSRGLKWSRFIGGVLTIDAGIALWLIATWIDGSGWVIGKILAVVAWLGMNLAVVWAIRARARRTQRGAE